MSQPTVTPQPAQDAGTPGTQEIPVVTTGVTATGTVQLPLGEPAPPAHAAAAGEDEDEVQPTGPVDFVPGLPGGAAPPPPAAPVEPEAATAGAPPGMPRPARTPQDRAALTGTGLAVLSLLLLELGLSVGFGTDPLWSAVPLWSAFATVATLLGLLPSAARTLRTARLRPDGAWRVAAGGLTGLAVFWVLVVLPRVDSDRGFVLTAALAALGAALWIAPARRG